MAQDDLTVFYTSGTGNTLRVVQWIEERFRERGKSASSANLEQAKPAQRMQRGRQQTLLLATPTHGFTTPWHVLRFALALPRGHGKPAYCLATRCGMRLGRFITDGLAGTCAYLLALILILKGYRALGVLHVSLPSNWYSLHPMQNERTVRMLFERAHAQVQAFADKIVDQQRSWLTGDNLYEAICGLLLAPISLGYLLMGRFFLAKLFFANKNCDGCGVCADVCAIGAIKMWGKKDPRPYWKHNCESCMRCAAFCPRDAVEASHLWVAFLCWITSIPVVHLFLVWLGEVLPPLAGLEGTVVESVLSLLYWYPVMFPAYVVLFVLQRSRLLNNVFTYATLTHYWSRYKAPSVKLRDLTRPRS